MTEIRLHVLGYADSDAQERAELAWGLQQELQELDGVEDIALPAGDAPAGAKGVALEWATLVVTLVGSLPPLVAAVRSWRGRGPESSPKVEIQIQIDGDTVTLSDTSPDEPSATWMAGHGG